ncbi:MAG: bifunctional folylpolyglutamate synthase/dihydrofolate synthase [Opitutales bacterium]
MDYAQTKAYLYGLKYHGAKYGIERMQLLAERLDHPERRYPCIHVAGTNGKGSVCAMLESVARAAGLTTGLFTSPHLVFLGERVQVNREVLAPEAIAAECTHLRALAESIGAANPDDHPSFFEFLTAIGFLRFAQANVDVALVEVGLGGRLDATNVIEQPAASVIVSIGYDHTEILGDTLEKIAREKAGIIKPQRPVFIGLMPVEAERAIREIAASRNAPVYSVQEAYPKGQDTFPETALEGEHQRANAALAQLVVRTLRDHYAAAWAQTITDDAIAQGLRAVEWAARWQRVRLADGRLLILDTTHNEPGATVLAPALQRLVEETGQPPIVITGVLGEGRAGALFPVIARYAESVVLLRPQQLRACTFEAMETALQPVFKGLIQRGEMDDVFPREGICTVGRPDQPIVVTGSLYLVGEVMERLFGHVLPSESHLQDGPILQPTP